MNRALDLNDPDMAAEMRFFHWCCAVLETGFASVKAAPRSGRHVKSGRAIQLFTDGFFERKGLPQ